MKQKLLFTLLLVTLFSAVNAQNNGWTELGGLNSLSADSIKSICSDAAGNIYAAGGLVNNNGKNYAAKFDGTNWSEVGGLNGLSANSAILSICSDAMGNLYAGGYFTNSSGNFYVAKFDGTSWSELGGLNGLSAIGDGDIRSICSDASGNIYAAGALGNGTNPYSYGFVAKYNGTSWSIVGGSNGFFANNRIYSIVCDNAGNIYAGGEFTTISVVNPALQKCYVAKFNGTSWGVLGAPLGGIIRSICSDGIGNIYAAGNLANVSGKSFVAQYNGSSWSELGGYNGLSANNSIESICSDANGNIYAAGEFTNSSGKRYVALYNGSSWSELGALNGLSASNSIESICSDANGNIYAGGYFNNVSSKKYVARINFCNISNIKGLSNVILGSSILLTDSTAGGIPRKKWTKF